MPFEFGTVVLVPFPFTSQAASKRRPAVVVSKVEYGAIRGDIIVMTVTSRVRADPSLGEIPVAEWQNAGLLKPSVVKPVLATLEGSLVLRTLGVLSPDDQAALRTGIQKILG
jgi:mRNA-degrading endonuclease toxin of MazEF toxin-antitoxin module